MGIIRFTLKSTLAGGLVYYTVQEGLWSKPEETLKLYCRMYNSVAPYIEKNIPHEITKEISDLPSVFTMSNCARAMWNKGVITSMTYLSELPTHISNGIDYVTSAPAVKGIFDAPSETKKS